MLRFMLIRILQALPVIFVVITATFFLVRSAPGGPFDQEKVVIPEVKKALEAQYRLDLPLHEQYFAYLGILLRETSARRLSTRAAASMRFFLPGCPSQLSLVCTR